MNNLVSATFPTIIQTWVGSLGSHLLPFQGLLEETLSSLSRRGSSILERSSWNLSFRFSSFG